MAIPNKKPLVAGVLAVIIAIVAPQVMQSEGKSNKAYLDPVGIPTICYGHTEGVHLGQVKTDAECEALLKGELGQAAQTVNRYVKPNLNVWQQAALTSFVYNVGEENFRTSRLLKKLNTCHHENLCDYQGAADEFLKWDHAGGKVLPGLVQRRRAERALFLR